MRLPKIITFFAVLLLAACVTGPDIATPQTEGRVQARIDVLDHVVLVPRSLKVSEANSYYPAADIVWREDGKGDRHQQVAAIMDEALDWGLAAFDRGRDVTLHLEVKRFHSLTEKARYTVGGVHSLKFAWTLFDARTGERIFGPKQVNADLNAYGGDEALRAEARGRTQRVRIRQHIAGVIQKELVNAGFGTFVARSPES